jgi:hypothetical protein
LVSYIYLWYIAKQRFWAEEFQIPPHRQALPLGVITEPFQLNNTNMNEILKNSEKLFSYAMQLQREFTDSDKELLELFPEVTAILIESKKTSEYSRTRILFGDLLSSHIAKLENLKDFNFQLKEITAQFTDTRMRDNFEIIHLLLNNADLNKIQNEEFIIQSARTRDYLIENSIPVWQYYVGVSIISIALSKYQHLEICKGFLKRPSNPNKALSIAIELAKSVGAELVGKVIPFFGVLGSLFEITKTHLDSELQKFGDAIEIFDRVFLFEEQILQLEKNFTSCRIVLQSCNTTLRENEIIFCQEAKLLIDEWSKIQKN